MDKKKLSSRFFIVLSLLFWGFGVYSASRFGILMLVLSVLVPPFGMLLGLYSSGSIFFNWLASFATWTW
jgi:hypothetical protein